VEFPHRHRRHRGRPNLDRTAFSPTTWWRSAPSQP